MSDESLQNSILPIQRMRFPQWPEAVDSIDFEVEPIEKPKPIIANLLHVGSRLIFGGGSKTYKTWAMCDLAISIAQAAQWWGFTTYEHKVLYVNFELQKYFMQQRLCAIRKAKGLKNRQGQLFVWNLRDEDIELLYFMECILKLIREKQITVVFIDPFYKLLGDRDERVTSEIMQLMRAVGSINRITGATVIFAAHFTKGNQAGKESMDRISGAGGMSRDPDNLITLTDHEDDDSFSVQFTNRDYKRIEPFGVRWQYPLLERDDQMDASKLKKAPNHRPVTCDPESLFQIISENDDQLNSEDLVERISADPNLSWSRRTVFNKLEILKNQKRIRFSVASEKWNVCSRK